MSNEIDKIEFFYKEGRRLWQSNPDYVRTKEFYELWESLHFPQPFTVGNDVELMGVKFDLPEYEGRKTAYYSWLEEDECPALLIETKEWEKRFLLTFDEGEAKIYEDDLITVDDDEFSMGEKLEVVMEVISYMRKCKSTKDILNLSKKRFYRPDGQYCTSLSAGTYQLDETLIGGFHQKSLPQGCGGPGGG